MEPILRRLTTHGLRRGFGGSRPWLVAGMLAVGARMLRRLANPGPDVLYRTKVKPGDVFEVVARRPTK